MTFSRACIKQYCHFQEVKQTLMTILYLIWAFRLDNCAECLLFCLFQTFYKSTKLKTKSLSKAIQTFPDWKTGVSFIQNQYLPGILISCPGLLKTTLLDNHIKRKNKEKLNFDKNVKFSSNFRKYNFKETKKVK